MQSSADLVTGGEEIRHLPVVLTTLQGQVPCDLHEPASLLPVPVPTLRKPLLGPLDVGYQAVQRPPGGGNIR